MNLSSTKTCKKCRKQYLEILSLTPETCPECDKLTQTLEHTHVPPDEYCDLCNTKINLQRIYFNSQKICPTCYASQLNNKTTKTDNNISTSIPAQCPKCGYKL